MPLPHARASADGSEANEANEGWFPIIGYRVSLQKNV
jgi:hypothetical protein